MAKLRVEVTVRDPEDGGMHSARWAVLDGDVEIVSGIVEEDPDGRHATHQAKEEAREIAIAMGEDEPLHEIPVSVMPVRTFGEDPHT
jgi:hypothetical protein